DPGVENWLDTAGYSTGVIFARWLDADSYPLPTLTKVRLADLGQYLPSDTAVVTAEERDAALRARRTAAQRRRRRGTWPLSTPFTARKEPMSHPLDLTGEQLLAQARHDTGIDIDDVDIVERLDRLTASLNSDAKLSEVGANAMQKRLLRILRNRLRMLRD